VAEAVGKGQRGDGNSGREMVAVKPWERARQRRPLSEGGRRGLGAVRAVRLTLRAHAVLYFSELSKPTQN
jgi:hypothetical protein